jgi:hypothetical protein
MNKTEAVYFLRERMGSIYESIKIINREDDYKTAFNEPFAFAIRQMGGSVSDIVADGVTTTDLSIVTDGEIDKFVDLSEYRAMLNALTAARRMVSISLGPRSESYSDIADGLAADVAAKKDYIMAEYGLLDAISGTITAGVVSLDFMETFNV